jgi:hypothetical protein
MRLGVCNGRLVFKRPASFKTESNVAPPLSGLLTLAGLVRLRHFAIISVIAWIVDVLHLSAIGFTAVDRQWLMSTLRS